MGDFVMKKLLLSIGIFAFTSGGSYADINEKNFELRAALVDQSFYCARLNFWASNFKEQQRLSKIGMTNGVLVSKYIVNETTKEKDVERYFSELDKEYKINNDVMVGFVLGSFAADAQTKADYMLNLMTDRDLDKMEIEAKRIMIEKNCEILR